MISHDSWLMVAIWTMVKAMPLHEMVECVSDRASFIAFVRALCEDRRDEDRRERGAPSNPLGSGANGWENSTVTVNAFLEASAAWADDVSKLTDERQAWFPEAPSWQAFARFLYMGTVYA